MAGRSLLVTLDGVAVWAFVVPHGDGLRLRLALDDWDRLGLFRGQRVPVRLPGEGETWVYVGEVREEPPVVWVTAVERVRAAG